MFYSSISHLIAKTGIAASAVLLIMKLVPAPVFADEVSAMAPPNWSGYFAGISLGYGQSDLKGTDTGRGPAGPWFPGRAGASVSDRGTGAIGGIRVGYNHMVDGVMVGVEADFSGANIHHNSTVFEVESITDISWMATVRARLGVPLNFTDQRAVVYGTGGIALAGITHSIGDTITASPGLFGPNSVNETRMALTVGGGVEVALSDNLTIGAEYLYTDFGTTSITGICVVCAAGAGTPYIFDAETKVQTVRATVSWKLGE